MGTIKITLSESFDQSSFEEAVAVREHRKKRISHWRASARSHGEEDSKRFYSEGNIAEVSWFCEILPSKTDSESALFDLHQNVRARVQAAPDVNRVLDVIARIEKDSGLLQRVHQNERTTKL